MRLYLILVCFVASIGGFFFGFDTLFKNNSIFRSGIDNYKYRFL
jgi:preprotein translocase subunit SecE